MGPPRFFAKRENRQNTKMGHFRYRTTNANSLSHTNTLNTSQNYFTEMHKYPNLKFEKVFRKISGSTRGIQFISKSYFRNHIVRFKKLWRFFRNKRHVSNNWPKMAYYKIWLI